MKLYTYKSEFIVQEYEYWTGHIDSYFNKRFVLKNVKPLIVPVIDNISEIIDQANDINFIILDSIDKKIFYEEKKFLREKLNLISSEQKIEFEKLVTLISKTHNTLFEFIDEINCRHFINIMNCQFKKFEKDIDISIYNNLASEAESYNIFVNSQIYEYIISINAYEDYINYHKNEQLKFKLIGDKISEILNDSDKN